MFFQNEDIGKLILRIGASFLLLFDGIHKAIYGLGGVFYLLEKSGLPYIMGYGAYVTEIISPILIIFGYKTRINATIVLFGFCMIIFLAYKDVLFALSDVGSLKPVLAYLYFVAFLSIIFLGAGKYSLDERHKA